MRNNKRWPKFYEVTNPRHSRCGSAKLKALDFDRWFTDTSFGQHYLHVNSATGDESVHRVTCAYSAKPRLAWIDGALWWVVDERPKNSDA